MSPGLTSAADDLLDLRDVIVAHLETGAGGHAQVDDELAGIGARKIGAAEERKRDGEQHDDCAQDHTGSKAGRFMAR